MNQRNPPPPHLRPNLSGFSISGGQISNVGGRRLVNGNPVSPEHFHYTIHYDNGGATEHYSAGSNEPSGGPSSRFSSPSSASSRSSSPFSESSYIGNSLYSPGPSSRNSSRPPSRGLSDSREGGHTTTSGNTPQPGITVHGGSYSSSPSGTTWQESNPHWSSTVHTTGEVQHAEADSITVGSGRINGMKDIFKAIKVNSNGGGPPRRQTRP